MATVAASPASRPGEAKNVDGNASSAWSRAAMTMSAAFRAKNAGPLSRTKSCVSR